MRRAAARKRDTCDPEFSKRSLDYLHQLTAQCVEQQVSRLVICDTTGGAGPEEVIDVIGELVRAYPARFGFHGHTDRGWRGEYASGCIRGRGASQGTVWYGRALRNVNLTTVIGSMQLRGEAEFVAPEALTGYQPGLCGVCRVWVAASARRADCGAGRLGTWAGMHGSSDARTRELICGATLPSGRQRLFGVNAQWGGRTHSAVAVAGVGLDAAQAQALLTPTRP